MRLYWAGSHIVTRLAEFPHFINAGFEIIPSEVVPSIHTFAEGMTYDDSDLPINKLWRATSTLSDKNITRLRRARLWERNGEVNQDEADLFNKYIDVLYVPTRLKIAINIAKWFKGIILFRFFGDLDGFGPSDYSDFKNFFHAPKRFVVAPVFESLLSSDFIKFFQNVCVVHIPIDERVVPLRWKGADSRAPALIVLSGIHQFPHFQDILRRLIFLASRIPIRVMGKNVISAIPADIRQHFDFCETLPRHQFFEKAFEAKVLLYPHARRNHLHAIPLEAIWAGMPVLFRINTPLMLERDIPATVARNPEMIGASMTNAGLMKSALKLYYDEGALSRVVDAQRILLAPFSQSHVRNEFKHLADLLRRLSAPNSSTALGNEDEKGSGLSEISTKEYFVARNEVVKARFRAPLATFFADENLNNVISYLGRPVIQLETSEPLKIVFGQRGSEAPVYFEVGRLHYFEVSGIGLEGGQLECLFEILVGDRIYQRESVVTSIQYNGLKPSKFRSRFRVSWPSPFLLILYLKKTVASGRILVDSFSHDE